MGCVAVFCLAGFQCCFLCIRAPLFSIVHYIISWVLVSHQFSIGSGSEIIDMPPVDLLTTDSLAHFGDISFFLLAS